MNFNNIYECELLVTGPYDPSKHYHNGSKFFFLTPACFSCYQTLSFSLMGILFTTAGPLSFAYPFSKHT